MIDSHVFGVRQKFQTVTHMQLYGNEREVGKAIRGSGLSRDEVFVTTKLWDSEWGYRASTGAIQDRLAELDVDYIDLLLLHTPGNPRLRAETWTALEDAQSGGLLRSIGVSNFGVGHLEKLLATAKIVPAVNQIELSPFLHRDRLVEYCKAKGIVLEAYSPLCKGSGRMLSQPQLTKVAKEAGVSTAQVMLRWSIQKGFVPLPKTTDETRMQQNFDIYSFELSPKQMATLDALERNFITAWDPSEDVPV